MKKRIIAITIATMIMFSTFSVSLNTLANDSFEEMIVTAIPVKEYDSVKNSTVIYDEEVSNFTTSFDYIVSRENSAGLLFDFDTDLKKTLYSENFENYEGDFQTASLSGHGTVLSVPHWTEYTLFTSDSGDFDFTMLLAMENRDWGQVSVHIKEDLSFDLKGTNHTNPYMLRFVKNDGTELAKIDLNDIDESRRPVGNEGSYLRALLKGNVLTAYLSSDSVFSDDEIVYTITLDEKYVLADNVFKIWQANNSVYADDIVIKDPNKSGYETVLTRKESFSDPIYSENFDSYTSENKLPLNSSLTIESSTDKCLTFDKNWKETDAIFNITKKNYCADFYLKSSNYDWDWLELRFKGDYSLVFKGRYANGNENSKYTVYLEKNGNKLAFANTSIIPVNGAFVRVAFAEGKIDVYLSADNNFVERTPDLSAEIDEYSNDGSVIVYKGDMSVSIDDINVYDLDSRYVTTDEKTTGEYNLAEIKNDVLSIYRVKGKTVGDAISSAKIPVSDGQMAKIALVRYMDKLTAFCNEKQILTLDIPFDSNLYKGNLVFENTDNTVKNIKVYDSGKINFKNNVPYLEKIELADISLIHQSDASSETKFEDESLSVSANGGNGSAITSGWFKEDVGDFVIDMTMGAERGDWLVDRFYFAVPERVVSDEKVGDKYQWDPNQLIKNGYVLHFGANEFENYSYGFAFLDNSNEISVSGKSNPKPLHWNFGPMNLRIAKKADKVRVYLTNIGIDPILIEEYTVEKFVKGNFYWYHRQGVSTASSIKVYDTENRKENSPPNPDAGKTRLISVWNGNKTATPIKVNEPGISEIDGPWNAIRNHRDKENDCDFGLHTESFIGNELITDFNISFTYRASGYWMNNDFYFATDKEGNKNGYKLRIVGGGIQGDRDYNVELIVRINGKDTTTAKAYIPSINDNGAFDIKAIAHQGKINVYIKPTNADWKEATVLSGDAGDAYIRGGFYMYSWGVSDIYIRDIAVYNGADITGIEKPDFSEEKKVYIDTDFSDDRQLPAKTFLDQETGIGIIHEKENKRLRVTTNDNHYLETDGFTGNKYLYDFTMDFEMKNLHPGWNLTWLVFHNKPNGDYLGERHLGALTLGFFGWNIANDAENGYNVAKQEGANVQLFKKIDGKEESLGYVNLEGFNDGREYRFKLVADKGTISLYAWPATEEFVNQPVIKFYDPTAVITYGDIYMHQWCSDMAFNRLRITNYADYTSPWSSDVYNAEIGEIFRVERIYDTNVDANKNVPIKNSSKDDDTNPFFVILICVVVFVAAVGFVTFVIIKKKKGGEILKR